MFACFICFFSIQVLFEPIENDSRRHRYSHHSKRMQKKQPTETKTWKEKENYAESNTASTHHSSKFIMYCINYVIWLFANAKSVAEPTSSTHKVDKMIKIVYIYIFGERIFRPIRIFISRIFFLYVFLLPSLKLEGREEWSQCVALMDLHLNRATYNLYNATLSSTSHRI